MSDDQRGKSLTAALDGQAFKSACIAWFVLGCDQTIRHPFYGLDPN